MTRADRQDALICGSIIAAFIVSLVFVFAIRAAHPTRARITNDSTYTQVLANFAGKPYSTGHFVSGYTCAGYTAGKSGHGWVVIRCTK